MARKPVAASLLTFGSSVLATGYDLKGLRPGSNARCSVRLFAADDGRGHISLFVHGVALVGDVRTPIAIDVKNKPGRYI